MQSYPSPNATAGDGGGGGPFYPQVSSQQQQASDLSTTEDLQLLAQHSHSRTIAPSMNAGPAGLSSEGQDPRGSIQNQYHEQPQQHAAVHMQASPAQLGPVIGQYDSSPDASNRKRSKVSRACDECRRKKIRCDATEESGDIACTSCKRVGSRCQFSRVPMKRGPSKGYIKELADRVQNLEGSLQVQQGIEIPPQQYFQHESPQQQRASEEFLPSEDSMQRKRTFSAVSGELGAPYQPQRPVTGWAPQELPRHLPHPSATYVTPHSATPSTATLFREPHYSPDGLQPSPQWRNAPEPVPHQGSSFESMPQIDHSLLDRAPEWDESIVDGYYNFIQPTYPLLAFSKSKLRSTLAQYPTTLHEAFYESLYAAVRSFPTPSAPTPEQPNSRKAAQLILASQYENAADRTLATNLIYLQVMLLMAIEADNRDPARPQTGFSQSFWLGSAIGLAYSMKLYAQRTSSRQSETDPDSDGKVARRIWWSLVVMDRWHAASISCPLLIPDSAVIVSQDDQSLLGDSLFHLTRLTIIVGHATLIPTDSTEPSVPSISHYGTLLRGELERFRESLPASALPPPNDPVMHLCYWYLNAFMAMRLPEYGPQDVCDPAMKIITQLKSSTDLICPLTHHATAFAALALIECTGYEQTRKEAESGLTALLESRIAPSGWDASVRAMIFKNTNTGQSIAAGGAVAVKSGTSQHIANQGLKQLAELATATTEGNPESSTTETRKEPSRGGGGQIFQRFHDLREMVRIGYLTKAGGTADR